MSARAQGKASARLRRPPGYSRRARPTNLESIERAFSRTLSWLSDEQSAQLQPVASIERIDAHSTVQVNDDHIRFLLSGALRCRYTDSGSKRRLSYFIGRGDIVSNLFFCSPGTIRYYEAIIDSSLLSIPVEAFAGAVAGIPWQAFKHSVAEILQGPFLLLALLTRLRGVPGVSRLAHVLLYLASKFGAQDSRGTILTIKVTKTDLAGLAGCSRQQLAVLLNALSKRGAATVQGSQMVLNIPKLTSLAAPGPSGIGDINRADPLPQTAPR